jgi:hypothetical protein
MMLSGSFRAARDRKRYVHDGVLLNGKRYSAFTVRQSACI